MKVLLTGAHFTPAQAVIEQFKKDSSIDIVYIGRKHTLEGDRTLSVEYQALKKEDIKFLPLVAGRIRRFVSFQTFVSFFKIPIGFAQAFFYVWKEKPDVVISFGGYVGLPVVFASWLLSVPVIVHEQTLVSGLANTVSNFFADKIAVSFDKNYSFNSNKTVVTGNPIRKPILDPRNKFSDKFEDFWKNITREREKLPVILITCGNQGSHFINQIVESVLPELNERCIVVHQTGDSKFHDYEKLQDEAKGLKHPERYLPVKWIEGSDYGVLLKKIDLAVCRAGANTLTELACIGVPSLMVPLPYLYKDEQMVNAKYFKSLGLGEYVLQKDFTAELFLQKIAEMLKNLQEYKDRAKKARLAIITDAAQKLAQEIYLLVEKV